MRDLDKEMIEIELALYHRCCQCFMEHGDLHENDERAFAVLWNDPEARRLRTRLCFLRTAGNPRCSAPS